MSLMPGGGISSRPLHFFIIADTSRSMMGPRIQSLNYAVPAMIASLEKWERDQEEARIYVRVLTFGESVTWIVKEPTTLDKFRWVDLKADGDTPMGEALRRVAQAFEGLESRALTPVLLLITDGMPNVPEEYDEGLAALLATRAGQSALRFGVAIGNDADEEFIARFIQNPRIPVMKVDDPADIGTFLVTMSSAITRMSVAGADRDSIAESLFGVATRSVPPDDDSIV